MLGATHVRELHQAMLQRHGITHPTNARVLDFGCGDGASVYAYRRAGSAAFGVDIDDLAGDVRQRLIQDGLADAHEQVFAQLDLDNFSLPFPDEWFDFVFSDQVFEHVQNYPESIREISRVLKPGGASLHIFPARWRPIETHVLVPFAGVVQAHWYLLPWAYLGIRNAYQKGLSARETAKRNRDYLRDCTTYYSGRRVAAEFGRSFQSVQFVERDLIACTSGRLASLRRLLTLVPWLPWVVKTFHMRAVLCVKE